MQWFMRLSSWHFLNVLMEMMPTNSTYVVTKNLLYYYYMQHVVWLRDQHVFSLYKIFHYIMCSYFIFYTVLKCCGNLP